MRWKKIEVGVRNYLLLSRSGVAFTFCTKEQEMLACDGFGEQKGFVRNRMLETTTGQDFLVSIKLCGPRTLKLKSLLHGCLLILV